MTTWNWNQSKSPTPTKSRPCYAHKALRRRASALRLVSSCLRAGSISQLRSYSAECGRATPRFPAARVYNTLELFVEKGLLQELNFGDRSRIYDTNLAPHHHLYHVDSGKIEDLDISQIKVKVPDEVLGNSSLVGVDVTLRVAG